MITDAAAQNSDNLNWPPSVSVVVPTYNSASTLGDCLESIKNQDYRGEVEIIIADGGQPTARLR